jgi:hypothetical protein
MNFAQIGVEIHAISGAKAKFSSSTVYGFLSNNLPFKQPHSK